MATSTSATCLTLSVNWPEAARAGRAQGPAPHRPAAAAVRHRSRQQELRAQPRSPGQQLGPLHHQEAQPEGQTQRPPVRPPTPLDGASCGSGAERRRDELDGLYVEVIGRLIEQQHVGFAHNAAPSCQRFWPADNVLQQPTERLHGTTTRQTLQASRPFQSEVVRGCSRLFARATENRPRTGFVTDDAVWHRETVVSSRVNFRPSRRCGNVSAIHGRPVSSSSGS